MKTVVNIQPGSGLDWQEPPGAADLTKFLFSLETRIL